VNRVPDSVCKRPISFDGGGWQKVHPSLWRTLTYYKQVNPFLMVLLHVRFQSPTLCIFQKPLSKREIGLTQKQALNLKQNVSLVER
jgi:hypothetical protein